MGNDAKVYFFWKGVGNEEREMKRGMCHSLLAQQALHTAFHQLSLHDTTWEADVILTL